MKLLIIPTICSAVLLAANVASAQPCTTGNCDSKVQTSNEVRQYGGIGTRNWSRAVLDRPTKGWFKTEFNKVMAEVVKNHSCAIEDHYPTLGSKVLWSEAYIDSKIKPTRSQAKDPNWSNYVWNRPEPGSDFVYDGITDALNDPLIDNGKGIAKLSVLVGLTSTSGRMIPPVWMQRDRSLTWLEGVNQNGSTGNWHVRFDNPVAVEHAADFLAAFLAKYGNNKGIHSINIGEYYTGHKDYRPSDLNRDKYWHGMKALWAKVVQSAPRDENNQRVNIVQTNPVLWAGVTVRDMEEIGIGISESDTRLQFGGDDEFISTKMRELYEGEKVHVMINGDARFACSDRRQPWDGTPNPFGHSKGYSGVASPQEIFWYHSEKGVAPAHSLFLSMASYCKGSPQTPANFINAIKQFGRCGTDAKKWGAVPAALPEGTNTASIARGKPTAPPAIAIK